MKSFIGTWVACCVGIYIVISVFSILGWFNNIFAIMFGAAFILAVLITALVGLSTKLEELEKRLAKLEPDGVNSAPDEADIKS